MPYNKRIQMSHEQALEEIQHIERKLEAQADNQDDAVQAVVEHISKIDDKDEQEPIKVPRQR